MTRRIFEHGEASMVNVKISIRFLQNLRAKSDAQELFTPLQSGDLLQLAV